MGEDVQASPQKKPPPEVKKAEKKGWFRGWFSRNSGTDGSMDNEGDEDLLPNPSGRDTEEEPSSSSLSGHSHGHSGHSSGHSHEDDDEEHQQKLVTPRTIDSAVGDVPDIGLDGSDVGYTLPNPKLPVVEGSSGEGARRSAHGLFTEQVASHSPKGDAKGSAKGGGAKNRGAKGKPKPQKT